jgi:hypothetical protein
MADIAAYAKPKIIYILITSLSDKEVALMSCGI